MLAIIGNIITSLASGIVGPITSYLGKRQDVSLDGFKTAAGLDSDAYKAALDHELAMNQLKVTAASWWGPRLLYMVVGLAAAAHSAGVFLDSTPFPWHAVGSWGVPKPPAPYDTYEQWVVASLFVVSAIERPVNALSTIWMRKGR